MIWKLMQTIVEVAAQGENMNLAAAAAAAVAGSNFVHFGKK